MATKKNTAQVEAPEVEEPKLYTTAELADAFNTDPKTLRRFFRSTLTPDSLPGKGGRYRFTAENVSTLQGLFATKGANKVTPMNLKGIDGEVIEGDEVADPH